MTSPDLKRVQQQTVKDKIEKMLRSRYRGGKDMPEQTHIALHLHQFERELEIGSAIELGRIVSEIAKETGNKIRVQSVKNLSVDGDVLNRECIPIDEIRMDSAYVDVVVDTSIFDFNPFAKGVPVVLNAKGIVSIAFTDNKKGHNFSQKKVVEIGGQTSLEGALVLALSQPSFGVIIRTDEVVARITSKMEDLDNDKDPDKVQIDNAMKRINKKLRAEDTPPIEVVRKTSGGRETMELRFQRGRK